MSDDVDLLRRWKISESMRRSTVSFVNQAADEIERLADELATMTIGLQAERALADDAAPIFAHLDYVLPDIQRRDIQAWLARYRKVREQ